MQIVDSRNISISSDPDYQILDIPRKNQTIETSLLIPDSKIFQESVIYIKIKKPHHHQTKQIKIYAIKSSNTVADLLYIPSKSKSTSKCDMQKNRNSIYLQFTDLNKHGICLLERMCIDERGRIHDHLHRGACLHDISKKAKVESLESLQQQTPTVIAHPHDSNTKPPAHPSYE